MLNCCRTKHQQRKTNNLEENKRNSNTSEKMPTKNPSTPSLLTLSCFKKRASRTRTGDDLPDSPKLPKSEFPTIPSQPDGPSVAYSDSENLDSLGNLPFSSKFPSSSAAAATVVVTASAPEISDESPSTKATGGSVHHMHNMNHLHHLSGASPSLPPPPNTTVAASRRGSLYIFRHSDDLIVTPFAQILASLRNVRANFILITNVHSSREARFGSISTSSHTLRSDDAKPESDDNQKGLTIETLEELEWCLEQLESIQTHRSVSDMASSKFKKILNKELSQYADHTKSGNQISDYICTTFLDKDVDSAESSEHFRGKRSSQAEPPLHNADCIEGENYDDDEEDDEDKYGEGTATSTTAAAKRSDTTAVDAVGGSSSTSSQPPASTKERHHKHTVSFKKNENDRENVAYLGVHCNRYPDLTAVMDESLDTWGMDIFKIAELSDNRPLTVISFGLFRKYQLFEKFSIHSSTFLKFITEIERQYRSHVPYHNSTHAADVTQSTNVLLGASPLENVFSDLELMSVIFACIVHDVDHPGVTNQYLINTSPLYQRLRQHPCLKMLCYALDDQLALLYNDSSVLENHHLSVAFTALAQPDSDITQHLPKKQRQSFRKMVIDMVLATDMSKHMSLLADLKTMVETKKVAGSGILNLDNYNDRIQILQNMVHCADLSNPTKPLPLYQDWTSRIMSEFFQQGDRERERGLEISPMCDRETATVEKSQVSFIDFIVHPLWETWSDLVYPEAQDILDTLEENRDWYFNQIPRCSPIPVAAEEMPEP